MALFEYHLERWQQIWKTGKSAKLALDTLNALGAQHWELIEIVYADNCLEATAVFKREVIDEPIVIQADDD